MIDGLLPFICNGTSPSPKKKLGRVNESCNESELEEA